MSTVSRICAVVTVICTISSVAIGDIVCPVCGVSYKEDVKICPNDGTDLTLVGKKKRSKTKTADVSRDEALPTDEEHDTDYPETERDDDVKYQRIDQTTSRRRIPQNQNREVYTDRRSRIADDRIKPAEVDRPADAEEETDPNVELNRQILSKYELVRTREWNSRKRTELLQAKAEAKRQEARNELLHNLGAPLTSIGFRLFWMNEGDDPGLVSAAELNLNLARYRLRSSLSSLIGVRSLSARDELVFIEHISLGFQWPWRFSPYAVIRGGVGVLAAERFGEDIVYLLTAVGVEAGIDSWITPWIAISPSVGYERCMVSNAYWNSVTFKLSIGF